MKLAALAVGFTLLVAACTSSTEPSSTQVTPTTVTTPTTQATISITTATPTTNSVTVTTFGLVDLSDMIVEERPMSAEELERFFDDDEVPFVDCEEAGGATWDYGPIDENSPRDRQPTDALRDALDDLNEGNDVQEGDLYWLPPTGWIALVRGEGSFVFVLADESDRWIAYVTVGGDPNEGIWRQGSMVGCDPRFL